MTDKKDAKRAKDVGTEKAVISGSTDGTALNVEENNAQDVEASANPENDLLPNSNSIETTVTLKTTNEGQKKVSSPSAAQSIDEVINSNSDNKINSEPTKEVSSTSCESENSKKSDYSNGEEKSDSITVDSKTSSAVDPRTVEAIHLNDSKKQETVSKSNLNYNFSDNVSTPQDSCTPCKVISSVDKRSKKVETSKQGSDCIAESLVLKPQSSVTSSEIVKNLNEPAFVDAHDETTLGNSQKVVSISEHHTEVGSVCKITDISKNNTTSTLTEKEKLSEKSEDVVNPKDISGRKVESNDETSKTVKNKSDDSETKKNTQKTTESKSEKIEEKKDSHIAGSKTKDIGTKKDSQTGEIESENNEAKKDLQTVKSNSENIEVKKDSQTVKSESDNVEVTEDSKTGESKSEISEVKKDKQRTDKTKEDLSGNHDFIKLKNPSAESKVPDQSVTVKSDKNSCIKLSMQVAVTSEQKQNDAENTNITVKTDDNTPNVYGTDIENSVKLSSQVSTTPKQVQNVSENTDQPVSKDGSASSECKIEKVSIVKSGSQVSVTPKPKQNVSENASKAGSSVKSSPLVSVTSNSEQMDSENTNQTASSDDTAPKTIKSRSIKCSKISSDLAVEKSEPSSSVKTGTMSSELTEDSEKLNIDEQNNCPDKGKSKLSILENNVKSSICCSSGSGNKSVAQSVIEIDQSSNRAVDKNSDLPSSGKEKKETKIQNAAGSVTEKNETAVELEKKPELSTDIKPTLSTKKPLKVSENSIETNVSSCTAQEKKSVGKANSPPKNDSEKTALLNAIEAVEEEVKIFKNIKETAGTSSDQEEQKYPIKAGERKTSTENQVSPAAKKNSAVRTAEKQEPVKSSVTVKSIVEGKVSDTSTSPVSIERIEGQGTPLEDKDSKYFSVVDKLEKPVERAPNRKEESVSKEACEKEIPEAKSVMTVKATNKESATEHKFTDPIAVSAKSAVSVSSVVERNFPKQTSSGLNESAVEVKKSVLREKLSAHKVSTEEESKPSTASVTVINLSENGSNSSAPEQEENLLDSQDSKNAQKAKQVAEIKFKEAQKDSPIEIKLEALSKDTGKSNISKVSGGQKVLDKTQQSSNDVGEGVIIKKVETSAKSSTSTTVAPKTVTKPRNSIENDPLLNITSECRVELEITKIPANCQTKLKSETDGKPIFVSKKDSTGSSTQPPKESDDNKQKSLFRNFVTNSGQMPKMMSVSPRSLNRAGMIKVRANDSAILSNTAGGVKRPGRKRAITVDMTNRPSSSPPMKVVKMDSNSLKPRSNMMQLGQPRVFPKSGTSPKTTSALEMLLMNRGVSHNSSISDASVANFCQVEQLVTEPDAYSTPIKQLKKLSTGSANSILKQIAYGSQQFGAITISPVKPAPSPIPVRPSSSISFKPGPRPGPIVRSSSVDDIIEGVVAGQGEISDKCLLELNSMGEPKKKRGRPRKVVPGAPTQMLGGEQTPQGAPQLFFVPRGPPPALVRLPAFKPISASVPISVPAIPPTPSESAMEISATEEEVEKPAEDTELKKSASGRTVRTCTMKEPKKKAGAKPNSGAKSRVTKKSKKEEEPSEPDPEEEARKLKELEEEAKRKEEQKERKQEERMKRLELRNQAIAEKKAKLKRRAEERKRQYYEKKQRLQEEKAEMERRRALAPPENFSEETQMGDERDDSFEMSRIKKGRMEVIDPESSKEFKVQQVAEYQWPLQGGEFFMLQEQISQYLGVKSFKRKYPDIKRRTIEAEERTFLCDSGLVSETMCDLGLTALRSADVLDIMFADFHDKYEEFRQHLRDMQAKEFSLKQLALAGKPTGEQLDSIEKAVQSAARWNSALNKSRQETRRCCLDLQTFVIQYPRGRLPKITEDIPKSGKYPVALIPGQFSDYYKQYSAAELRYFPINTVLYGPIKPYNVMVRESQNNHVSDSEASSSSDGSSCSSSDASDSEDSSDAVTMDSSDIHGPEGAVCKICKGTKGKNKRNKSEVLIQCAQCNGSCHPTCLDLSSEMVPHIYKYDWQCTDCKKCARCKEAADEDKMLFCDLCDRGYHIYCVGLRKVPVGRWHCLECAVCALCGGREPGASETSSWNYEYKKSGRGGKNTYIRSFCENCAKDYNPGEGNILKKES